jgi:hypothetical protein
LFNIVHRKQAKVAEVLSSTPLIASFRRALMGNKLVEWNNLVARVANVYLQHGPNVFVWSLHKNGIFSVNTIYKFLVNNRIKVSTIVWKLKIPLKIKIFV